MTRMDSRGMVIAIVAVIGVMALALGVMANPGYLQMFRRVEKPPARSQLDRARCRTCHIKQGGGGSLNPYGEDLRKNSADEEALRKIESLDSDSDGASNAKEIAAGTLPGDPKSKPSE